MEALGEPGDLPSNLLARQPVIVDPPADSGRLARCRDRVLGWHRLLRRAERYEELPLAALQAIAELRPQLAALERAAIKVAREKGATWEEIATALGVTRQAAQMRFRTDSPSG